MHVYQSHVKFTSKPSHLWVKVMPCWSIPTHTLPEEHVQQVTYAKSTPVHVHLSQEHHNDISNMVKTNPIPVPSTNMVAMYHSTSPWVNLSRIPPNPILERNVLTILPFTSTLDLDIVSNPQDILLSSPRKKEV